MGRILFVCTVLLVMLCWRRAALRTPAWAWRVPVYVAGVPACFWFIERSVRIVL